MTDALQSVYSLLTFIALRASLIHLYYLYLPPLPSLPDLERLVSNSLPLQSLRATLNLQTATLGTVGMLAIKEMFLLHS